MQKLQPDLEIYMRISSTCESHQRGMRNADMTLEVCVYPGREPAFVEGKNGLFLKELTCLPKWLCGGNRGKRIC